MNSVATIAEMFCTNPKSLGFQLSYFDEYELVFYSTVNNGLFQRIRLSLVADCSKASSGVDISVVPGRTALKSLCIHEFLKEPSDFQGGFARIHTIALLQKFLDRVLEVGPLRCKDLEKREGKALLDSTRNARLACSSYLQKLRARPSAVFELNVVQQKAVDRILAEWIMVIPNEVSAYRDAVHVIVRHCDEVEGIPGWITDRKADPPTGGDRELMKRIQILASILAGEVGSDQINLEDSRNDEAII